MADPDKPVPPADAVPEQLPVVETPTSPSSAFSLSRFEFETGKGNEGSKILMVEWTATVGSLPGEQEAGADTATNHGSGSGEDGATDGAEEADWDVTWEGKAKAVGVRDREADLSVRRLYFFLPPGSLVPSLVTITPRTGASSLPLLRILCTKPMPAIFPAELVGAERQPGRLGVLHTLWAHKRLAELQAEIADEMTANGESVGLEMAMQERQWIVDHFGLAPADGVPRPTKLHIPVGAPVGPTSPRSPIGGKLGEKLKGLKLATSPIDLAAAAVGKRAFPHWAGFPFSSRYLFFFSYFEN